MSEARFSIGLFGAGGKVLKKFRPCLVNPPTLELIDGALVTHFENITWKVGFRWGRPAGGILYADGKEFCRSNPQAWPKYKCGDFLTLDNFPLIIRPATHTCPLGGKWNGQP